MSLVKPTVYDGSFQRRMAQGDVAAAAEVPATLTTVGAGTLTGALLANNILTRTGPTAAFNETTDTAAGILAAVMGLGNPSAGDSWRLRYENTVAFIATLIAGVGVTLVGTTTVAASSMKDFLITLTNATPPSIAAANTTNASAIVTGMTQAQTALVSVGQLVTGTGISASTTVLSVQPGVGVTLSANATATNSLVALTFSPTVTIKSLGQLAA